MRDLRGVKLENFMILPEVEYDAAGHLSIFNPV